jgi:threonine-phosphate decarboxylase
MINGHGDDIYNHYGKEIVSNFSSNIYSRQDLSALQEHLRSHLNVISSYPEPDARSLALLLGEKQNIEAGNICVTNGATEAIYLIAQAFIGKTTTIITPTFSEYEDACRINEHQLSFASSLSQVDNDSELVWLCNPNNPSGSVYHKQYLDKFISAHPGFCFIIDQSYEDFTDKQYTFTAKEGLKYKNVILLHSMTKSYAIPGLRLGYITACNKLIDKASSFCMPWSVNQLAIEAGKYLLKEERTSFDLTAYLAETNRLMTALNEIQNLVVLPTHTHFFLCELVNRKAADLKQYLIYKYGILIRDAANFRGLDERYFRIATQSPEENNQLIKAIREWI